MVVRIMQLPKLRMLRSTPANHVADCNVNTKGKADRSNVTKINIKIRGKARAILTED